MKLLRNTSVRAMRRGYPIAGYIGPNGGGKTTAAVWDTLPSLAAGRRVLSTVRLLDFENPRPCDLEGCDSPNHSRHMAAHPGWIPWTTWRQLLDVEHCDVLADEVTGVASSRDSQSMPSVIANALVQLRRRDVVLRWTAPSWSRADLIIRECSQAATLCTGFFPVRVAGGEGEEERHWRHRRLFRWLTYDASLLDDFSTKQASAGAQGAKQGLRPWCRDLHWGPGSPAFDAFDTFDAVSTIGHVSDAGRCLTCGGRRTAAACSCEDYEPPTRRTVRGLSSPDSSGEVRPARRTRSAAGSPSQRSGRGASDSGAVLLGSAGAGQEHLCHEGG